MTQLRALDLFCGAGGATRGLQNAGFHVTGVDVKRSPRYVGDSFIEDDVLALTAQFIANFDYIHASPPCQAHSALRVLHNARKHPDLIPQTREMLVASGVPYVIENVIGAPLCNAFVLCGTMFGLGVEDADLRRHRQFEASFDVDPPKCNHNARSTIGIYGGHIRNRRRVPISPTGHDMVANAAARRTNREAGHPDYTIEDGRVAMGIDWMTRDELSQAIPPAYSEWIARQWLATHAPAELHGVQS